MATSRDPTSRQFDKILTDGRCMYHDEMRSHFRNHVFMTPSQLQALHDEVKTGLMRKLEVQAKTRAWRLHKEGLEKGLDDLLELYTQKNYRNFNSCDNPGIAAVSPAIGIYLGGRHFSVATFCKGVVSLVPICPKKGGTLQIPIVPLSKNFYIADMIQLLGLKSTDPEQFQQVLKDRSFTIQYENGSAILMMDGKPRNPKEILVSFFSRARKMAEQFLKLPPGTINNATITVPADLHGNERVRHLLVDGGKEAGLHIQADSGIMDESTAAALAYSVKTLDAEPKKVLVYDLGNTSLNVSVVVISPQTVEIRGTRNKTNFGGENFLTEMKKYCASCLKAKQGIDLVEMKDPMAESEEVPDGTGIFRWHKIIGPCKQAMIDLGSVPTTKILTEAVVDSWMGVELAVEMTREKFKELNQAHFETAIEFVDESLKELGLQKEEIDDIVLVGGYSTIPKVQEMLSGFFSGKALSKTIHPEFVVAHGAALQAALLGGKMSYNQSKLDPPPIKNLINKAKSSYVGKIEDVLKENPHGLKAEALEKSQHEIVEQLKAWLENEVKQVDPDPYLIDLCSSNFKLFVNEDWDYIKELNSLNLQKGVLRGKQQRLGLRGDTATEIGSHRD